jgi:RNA 2',3'-cyclic 3'-phosphodiesterase
MERLFVAIPLPEVIKQQILLLSGGIHEARWQTSDQLHLTLRFIGEVDGATAVDIVDGLSTLRADAFNLQLTNVGVFGPKGRERLLWVGVKPSDALVHLRDRVESVLVRGGLEPERRKFRPHATIARLKGARHDRLNDFVAAHSAFETPAFEVVEFALYSSFLSRSGSTYTLEAAYPLDRLDPQTTENPLDGAHVTAAKQAHVDQ